MIFLWISRFGDEDMQTLNEGVTPKIANSATWAPGLQLPLDLWEASAPFCQRAVPEPDQFVYLRVLRYRNSHRPTFRSRPRCEEPNVNNEWVQFTYLHQKFHR